MRYWSLLTASAAATMVGLSDSQSREISFEERVKAQEAIERVYHRHQIGAKGRFEEDVPRAVLEAKVRRYLQQSSVVANLWKTEITDPMLEREVGRMASGTRLPSRLRELFGALHDDTFLVKECLARATLADRLTRSFYSYDPTVHAEARKRTERLREALVCGALDPRKEHPDRRVVELIPDESDPPRAAGQDPARDVADRIEDARRFVSASEFAQERMRLPSGSGSVSPIDEEGDAFVIRVVLSDGPRHVRYARYAVAKESFDVWWSTAKDSTRGDVAAVAADGGPLPVPRWSCDDDNTWQNGNFGRVPDPREEHTAVWTGTEMIVWGGGSISFPLDTGGRYDPATDTWRATSTVGAPAPRVRHTAVWTGTRMVVWGGIGDGFRNDGGQYDPGTDTWAPIATDGAPAPRQRMTAIWTGSRMVIWGGQNAGFFNDGGRYDPETDTWSPVTMFGAPSVRQFHSAVWTGSQMVVWGGSTGPVSNLDSGGRYDPETDSWTPTATGGAPPRRRSHVAVWTGNEMLIWGGIAGGAPTNNGAAYDPVNDTWRPISTAGAPSDRGSSSGIWTGSTMVVWGGIDGAALDTGGKYDPATDTWTATSTVGAAPQWAHTAVWTGGLMLVWGGRGDGRCRRYDPAADAWTVSSNDGIPQERIGHTAVWDGSRMLVWGGYASETRLDTGGTYDPATDKWTATSRIEVPEARANHAAVWSGTRMLVWGGDWHSSPNYFATGGTYDPVADKWRAMSTSGAPSARSRSTAVWTGGRMLIWGGTGPGYLDTGGAYDPQTDTWTATSTVDAPAARFEHTAIWTGTKMLVWGGRNTGPVGTGAAYDPLADAWIALSDSQSPAARNQHTAVWTGRSMVVWGGVGTGEVLLGDGGAYHPETDSWSGVANTDAPTPRTLATAIWTGSEMLLWGGYDPGGYSNTGGRYDPESDRWKQIPTFDAPPARYRHTAVWAENMMLVWGGDANEFLLTGGRYVLIQHEPEVCDGFDNDCDGETDNGIPAPSVRPVLSGSRSEGAVRFSWPEVPGVTGYDVTSGDLDLLRSSSGNYAVSTTQCLANDLVTNAADDASTQEPGTGTWYLVRAVNSCGGNGTYDGTSPRQAGARDTEIAASGNACP